MASPSSATASPDTQIEADNDNTAMPLTMAASMILDNLPKDAHKALETAGEIDHPKVTIRLSPLPGAAQLRQPRFKCSSNQRFEAIVRFLRKKLGVKEHESVFCYVNSVFAPGLDEGVGTLWRCFKTGEELVVNYSLTQAFG